MKEVISQLKTVGVDAGLKIIYALVIIFIGGKLIKLVLRLIKNSRAAKRMDPTVEGFVHGFVKIALYIVLFISAAGVLGIPLTSFITLLASAGLAIGMSLQGGLANIAGGLIILIFKPFKVGDYIDNHNDSGTVMKISIFYTYLQTPDNRMVYIPNGTLANQEFINYTQNEERRLDFDLGVSYDSDIKEVKEIIKKVIDEQKEINKEKEIFVRLTDYLDSSLKITVRVWVNKADYFNVKFNLLERIKEEFDKHHIVIPFNQLDVHLDK